MIALIELLATIVLIVIYCIFGRRKDMIGFIIAVLIVVIIVGFLTYYAAAGDPWGE